MNMTYKTLSVSLLTLLLCTGCAKIPMTSKVIQDIGGNINDTKEFQYYVSRAITLQLVDDNVATTIEHGQLIRKRNTSRSTITIKDNLPGIVTDAEYTAANIPVLSVAFEKMEDNPVLHFSPLIMNNIYVKYFLTYDDPKNNIIRYGNNYYKVSYGKTGSLSFMKKIIPNKQYKESQSLPPYLLIKMKSSHHKTAKSRKASGLRLGE